MSSITKQVRNILGKLNIAPSPISSERDVLESPRLRIDNDTYINIRLHRVENGWVIQSYHEKKNNTLSSTRVVPDDADVMKEIEAAVAIFKIG